mgnify:CR=1 FL=1
MYDHIGLRVKDVGSSARFYGAALASVDFTDRYFHTPGRFAAKKDSGDLDVTPAGLDGKKIAQASSDAEGNFEIKLPAGKYILHPESPEGGILPRAEDVEFTVNPDEYTEIVVNFDSGIR